MVMVMVVLLPPRLAGSQKDIEFSLALMVVVLDSSLFHCRALHSEHSQWSSTTRIPRSTWRKESILERACLCRRRRVFNPMSISSSSLPSPRGFGLSGFLRPRVALSMILIGIEDEKEEKEGEDEDVEDSLRAIISLVLPISLSASTIMPNPPAAEVVPDDDDDDDCAVRSGLALALGSELGVTIGNRKVSSKSSHGHVDESSDQNEGSERDHAQCVSVEYPWGRYMLQCRIGVSNWDWRSTMVSMRSELRLGWPM